MREIELSPQFQKKLLQSLNKWEESFFIRVSPIYNHFRVILREKKSEHPQFIVLSISNNKDQYSIHSYRFPCKKEVYSVLVEGDTSLENIINSLEELCTNETQTTFSYFPF